MFERIVVRQATNAKGGFDLGILAEMILFYGQVHLLLDRGKLTGLCKEIGLATIFRLLRSGHVRATYIYDLPVIMTKNSGRALHTPTQIQMGSKDPKRGWSAEEQ